MTLPFDWSTTEGSKEDASCSSVFLSLQQQKQQLLLLLLLLLLLSIVLCEDQPYVFIKFAV